MQLNYSEPLVRLACLLFTRSVMDYLNELKWAIRCVYETLWMQILPPWRLYCKVRVLGDCYSSVIVLDSRRLIYILFKLLRTILRLGKWKGLNMELCVFRDRKKGGKRSCTCLFQLVVPLFMFLLKRTCKDKVRAFILFDSAWWNLTNGIETWRLFVFIFFFFLNQCNNSVFKKADSSPLLPNYLFYLSMLPFSVNPG